MNPELATSATVSGPSGAPWWQQASTAKITAAAIVFGVFVFALLSGSDYFSAHTGHLFLPMLGIDASISALCGGLLLKVIRDAQRRHRRLRQRLEMIADMNHHIRNALEEIELTAHSTHDQQLVQDIHVAVSRIQWALREILPLEERHPD